MNEPFTQKSCADFVGALASSAPTPGGGGAAALVGAIGVALGNMVGSLTVGKKKYAAVEAEVLALQAQSDRLQAELLALVERDAEVFAPLAKAYGLPTETEPQRAEKARVMERVLGEASAVPLELMERCLEALDLIERFTQIGSRLAISDAGCAASCCRSALCAGSLNVLINTKAMGDRALAAQLNARVETMLQAGTRRADAIFDAVRAQLN